MYSSCIEMHSYCCEVYSLYCTVHIPRHSINTPKAVFEIFEHEVYVLKVYSLSSAQSTFCLKFVLNLLLRILIDSTCRSSISQYTAHSYWTKLYRSCTTQNKRPTETYSLSTELSMFFMKWCNWRSIISSRRYKM